MQSVKLLLHPASKGYWIEPLWKCRLQGNCCIGSPRDIGQNHVENVDYKVTVLYKIRRAMNSYLQVLR